MIGASHHRIGGERFVLGAGLFVADVRVPGTLHAALLRFPDARLVSVGLTRLSVPPGRAWDAAPAAGRR